MMDDAEIFAALTAVDAGEILTDTTDIVSDSLADMSDIDELLEEIDAEELLQALE